MPLEISFCWCVEEFVQWDVDTAFEEVVCQNEVPPEQPSFDGDEVHPAESFLVRESSWSLDHTWSQPMETLRQIDVPSMEGGGCI